MMKKLMVALTAALLGACVPSVPNTSSSNTVTGTVVGVGTGLAKMWVDNQCRVELNKRNEWRLIALAMSAEKQVEWEDKICGCASEEVLNNISVAELPLLATESGRVQVLSNLTLKTVTSCFKKVYTPALIKK